MNSFVVNLLIKADVRDITLPQTFELLAFYMAKKKREKIEECDFAGHRFRIETEIDLAIHYAITQLD